MNHDNGPRLFSVGHSNHDLARFLQLLETMGVTAVADVRSSPHSRWLPQYNRPELEQALRQCGITYSFLGDLLGGRPEEADLYDHDGRADYERMRATAAFRLGLDRLMRGMERFTVAMMCTEEDPLDCHRALMIAPALIERGIRPAHLRGNGSVESTEELEVRLLAEAKVGADLIDRFSTDSLTPEGRAALLADAYRQRARNKAFRLPPGMAPESLWNEVEE